MRVPPGYTMGRVLSPGPVFFVAEVSGPQDQACVLKAAVSDGSVLSLGREASILRALARAKVEGVPRVLGDAGRWIVLERLDMQPLDAMTERTGRDIELWTQVAIAAFARLTAVHDARDEVGPIDVIHGDIAPGNVLVTTDGRAAALVDFGLARWRGGAPPSDGAIRGTLLTMAPEVARSQRATARSDDFAMAASILQVATGVTLRTVGTSKAALLTEAAERPFDASHPWSSLAAAIFPPEIAADLLACLAFDPRARPRMTPVLRHT